MQRKIPFLRNGVGNKITHFGGRGGGYTTVYSTVGVMLKVGEENKCYFPNN